MTVWQFLSGCVCSAGFFQLIQFFITRHDNKKGNMAALRADIAELRKQSVKNERDSCRTQMLLLMSNFPEERSEIMTLARRYFVDLEGDWYATSIFQAHLEKNGIPLPPWFNANHHNNE